MSKVIITQDPVHFKKQTADLPASLIVKLEESRREELFFLKRRENINGVTVLPAPWEMINATSYRAIFSWEKAKEPEIIDTDYRPLIDQNLKTLNAMAKLIFVQKGFFNNNQKAIGTRLLLKGIQIT